MSPIATPTQTNDTEASPRKIAFERARDAVTVIRTVRPMLTPSQAETLALLLDDETRETIERSVGEAERGQHRPLKEAIDDTEDE